VDIDDLLDQAWRITALVAILVIVVRPVAVALSMVRSSLEWRDRALISWVDPRGVVAAATAAAFAGPLSSAGFEADFLLPAVFGVILGTGLIYGLTARPVASLLGLRRPPPKGVVVVGNERWLADMATCLKAVGIPVLVVSSDPEVRRADDVHDVETASILDTETDLRERIDDLGAAKALVNVEPGMTQNLVVALLTERLGRRHVYRVFRAGESSIERTLERAATARAFGDQTTNADIRARIEEGGTIRVLEPDTAPAAEDLVLASVHADGWVNLRPSASTSAGGESLIVLRR
jgi:hypothetical protein